MKNLNHTPVRLLPAFLALTALLGSPSSGANEQITRAYQSMRSAAMGGVRTTTGLYDENFFSNPARVTANPASKFELFQTGVEVSNIGNVSNVVSTATSNGDIVKALGDSAGHNTHVRFQETPFGFFLAPNEDRKWGLGVALISSLQLDTIVHQSPRIGLQGIEDIGPAATFGYKMLEDKFSVGITSHFIYRLDLDPSISLDQLVGGRSLSPKTNGAQGMMLDFDLGGTYELPIWQESPFKFNVAASINNILGGKYANMGGQLISNVTCTRADGTQGTCSPTRVNRSLSVGASVTRKEWGVWSDTSFAFEINDIGNNSSDVYAKTTDSDAGSLTDAIKTRYGSGSLFRMVHMGAETHWKLIALRAGINQGYLCGGVGFDLRFFTLDLSTYSEEMSLNPGGLEDRRYAVQFGFQI